MAKDYAIYPFDYLCITQRYDQGNHIPHWKGSKNYSDKPWDEACKDGGRSYFIPQNDYKIVQILGLGTTAVTNSVRLVSVNKLTMPCGRTDYLELTLTHMNEDNLKKVKAGQILKKGSKILMEGTDGRATGNHFHITANIGKYYGLLENSNGAWCFTYQKSLLPQEAFYINPKFTNIISTNGIKFKEVPKEQTITKRVIVTNGLNMRDKPSISGKVIMTIKHNEKVIYLGDSGKHDSYDWCKIKYAGKTGYVAKKFLK